MNGIGQWSQWATASATSASGWDNVRCSYLAVEQLGRERRAAAREARRARPQSIGRPKALDSRKLLWRNGCMPAVNRRARLPTSWAGRHGGGSWSRRIQRRAWGPAQRVWRKTPASSPQPHGGKHGLVQAEAGEVLRQWLAHDQAGAGLAHRGGSLDAVAALPGYPLETRSARVVARTPGHHRGRRSAGQPRPARGGG